MAGPSQQQINFNLDTAEKERVYEPFVVAIGDRTITLKDAKDIDWKDALDIERPLDFFRYCFADEGDKDFFKKLDIPAWKLDMLIDAYQKHYGMSKPGGGAASRL